MNSKQRILEALLLASTKRHDEALGLLNSDPSLISDEMTMELRARILFDQGMIKDAQNEWRKLAEAYPGNESALIAFHDISGCYGWMRRNQNIALACSIIVLAMLGAFMFGRMLSRPVSIQKGVLEQARVVQEAVVPSAPERVDFLVGNSTFTSATTDELKHFLLKGSEEKMLLIFSSSELHRTIFQDIAVELGFPPTKIICVPVELSEPKSAVFHLLEELPTMF